MTPAAPAGGLAITRDIILRHGGSVRVDPDGHRGAAFVVDLPLEPPTPPSSPTGA